MSIKKLFASMTILIAVLLGLASPALAISDQAEEKATKKLIRQEEKTAKMELNQEQKAARLAEKEQLRILAAEQKASRSAIKNEFKLKIAQIKDTRKQLIVEQFVTKMNSVNQKRVEHWNKILARLSEILAKIASTGTSSETEAAVALAQTKLDAAQAAVDAQGAKEYTMTIASDSALKSNAGRAMSGEQSELRQVSTLVNEAKRAVHDALRSLKKEKGGTPSPSLTPTVSPTASPSAIPTI